jgi:two-component system response regulator YesN
MKLIIADDEKLIRASIRSMVQDVESSWHIVGEGANGEELLELVNEHKPNVAIIDIRMPRMNGLEAMRLGKAISPCTKWIILSGFSDFAYVQEALQLGASDYLLKPVNPLDLERALTNTAKHNKEFIQMHNQQFENSLFALCNGLTTLKFEELDSVYVQGWFIGAVCIFDTTKTGKSLSDMTCAFYDDLRERMTGLLVYGMNFAMVSLPDGECAAIGSWDPLRGFDCREQVQQFFDELAGIAEPYRQEGLAITILQTGECRGFDQLNVQLAQLGEWSHLRVVRGIGQRIRYVDLESEAQVPDSSKISQLFCAIKQHMYFRAYLNYQTAVGELEGLLLAGKRSSSAQTQRAIHLYMVQALGVGGAYNADATRPEAEVIRELREMGESKLREIKPREPVTADLIEQVVKYLEQHYMDDIGIGSIAQQLNVSANYLSMLFNKKTGTPFVKYLTNIRMLKAKELLLNTNLQVKQIAEKVGYYSTRHFTKLFVENCSSYPSDYRKSHV